MQRPVKIAEYEWGVGVEIAESFNPWELFFSSTRVINRLANFNLLRADLHLRVLVNGNAFHFGRALMYYRPLDSFDKLSTDSALIRQDLIGGSQCPHIYLDPTTSQGGELVLPFFWHQNYFDVPNTSWTKAGIVYLRALNALKHANGAIDRVTITVMAWAENVQMSVLTSINPADISPQMGEMDEANSKGFISGPATMIAKMAGALAVIPWIRPYALASEYAANGVAQAAKIFGYCKPTVTAAPTAMRPTPTSSLALTNVPDMSQKLTVDAKQELTIDPRISGIESRDPLSIKGIAMRESYLTSFAWNVGTDPDSMLWNVRPQPLLYDISGGVATHLTALAAAALPFQKWTGSLRFRFQIVASNFHRGRLRFVWDPQFIVDPTSNYNTTHSTIVDIAEERDFTLEIANGQNLTLLEMLRTGLSVNTSTNVFSTTPYAAVERLPTGIQAHNGTLGVYVLNELTVPNSEIDNNIEINVFVSAGDDFEVAIPYDYYQNYAIRPQSGTVDTPTEDTTEPSAPLQTNTMQMNPEITEIPSFNTVFTGEAITSFRPLLKRFCLHSSIGALTSGNVVSAGTRPMFPYHRGNVAGAVNTTGSGASYSYANFLLLQYVTAGFSGWRGSIRWKLLPRGNLDSSQRPTVYITRERADWLREKYTNTNSAQENYPGPNSAAAASVNSGAYTSFDNQKPPPGVLGSAYTHGELNPTMEFEVPFYSSYRFVPGKVENYTTDLTNISGSAFSYRIYMNGEASTIYDFHCAAGDDFQTYFWTGMPRLYRDTAPEP